MNLWLVLIIFYISNIIYCEKILDSKICFVFLSQNWEYEDIKINKTIKNIKEQEGLLNINNSLFLTSKNILKDLNGYWTIFPIITGIQSNPEFSNKKWYLFLEPTTNVNLVLLNEFIKNIDIDKSIYLGKSVLDSHPVIIHHYYGYDPSKHKPIYYPLTASGLLMNINFIKDVDEKIKLNDKELNNFNIDAKFEFAKFVKDKLDIDIINDDRFCFDTDNNDLNNCITIHKTPLYDKIEEECQYTANSSNTFIGVKTFSGYYKSRLPIILNTWAKNLNNIGFFGDIEDKEYSTIKLDIPNVSKGHCEKTLGIIKYFVKNKKFESFNWLIIGDDDTLFNIPKLYEMLSCVNYKYSIVVGERYGFRHRENLIDSYDYPTGGSGMFFTREAAKIIAENCLCATHTTPDDMAIGYCIRKYDIRFFHSPALHQSSINSYSETYLRQTTPISFHKFEEVDPYYVFSKYLTSTQILPPEDLSIQEVTNVNITFSKNNISKNEGKHYEL
ncbi:Beta-1,3-glucosyltransferase [Strongyloides ratti]|uniref:N-acetylgalactosaminide beta-1,3-galactosyltransferase n=1 Tax=Strongyloides ratti TaxID=34506 RepID=A0A090KX86_STRRB|nr:Beta-1,3-glucosyltransferase [Strongyloides ratti]CEF62110.1 Beta-1,3-glucosyltransferase [Strongyloides ratti]